MPLVLFFYLLAYVIGYIYRSNFKVNEFTKNIIILIQIIIIQHKYANSVTNKSKPKEEENSPL